MFILKQPTHIYTDTQTFYYLPLSSIYYNIMLLEFINCFELLFEKLYYKYSRLNHFTYTMTNGEMLLSRQYRKQYENCSLYSVVDVIFLRFGPIGTKNYYIIKCISHMFVHIYYMAGQLDYRFPLSTHNSVYRIRMLYIVIFFYDLYLMPISCLYLYAFEQGLNIIFFQRPMSIY